MQAVILAAGRGTRLGKLSRHRSKAMMPVVGKPIVERVMDTLLANGVSEFVVVSGPGDGEIADHFGPRPGVRLVPQLRPLGAAHALGCAAPLIRGDFVLSACDNLVAPEHVGRMLAAWGASPRPNAVLALMPVEPEQLRRSSSVAADGPWVTRIVEKPEPGRAPSSLAALPLYVFSRRILEYLADVPLSPRGEYELPDAIQTLIEAKGRVRGVMVPERLTLTTPDDLLAINRRFLAHADEPLQVATEQIGSNTRLIPPLRIEAGTVVGVNSIIGPEIYVESGCQIGDGVTIRKAVVLNPAVVPDGAVVEGKIVTEGDIGALREAGLE